jgi:hypothetical protein
MHQIDLERHLCLVEVIYGSAYQALEETSDSGLIDVIVRSADLALLKASVRLRNLAIRVRNHCAQLSLRGQRNIGRLQQ